MEAIKALKRARVRKATKRRVPPELKAEAEVAAPKRTSARVKVKHKITVEVPKLPQGCVFHEALGKGFTLYCIEIPEQMKAVSFYPQKDSKTSHSYFLSWPRTLWSIIAKDAASPYPFRIYATYVSATKSPFAENGLKTELFKLPMPNLGSNGVMPSMLCMGYSMNSISLKKENYAQYIDEALAAFLGSKWNNGIHANFNGTGITSLADWHKKSKKDPAFHSKMILAREHQKTFEEALNSFKAYYGKNGGYG